MNLKQSTMKQVNDNIVRFINYILFFLVVLNENGEPSFPLEDLLKLEEQVNRIRWTIPVLPGGELIKCLRAAVRLARESMSNCIRENHFK